MYKTPKPTCVFHFPRYGFSSPMGGAKYSTIFFLMFLLFLFSENERTSEINNFYCAEWRTIAFLVPLYVVHSVTAAIKNMFNHVAVVKFYLALLAGFGQKSHEGFLKVITASIYYLNHTVSVPEEKGPVVGCHFQDKIGRHNCSCKWKKYCGSDKKKEIALSRGSSLSTNKRQIIDSSKVDEDLSK